MDISKFLSKVIGLYLLIISIAMLSNMQLFINSVNNLTHNVTLMFVMGFFTLIIGLLMVVSHNIWQASWRVIITLFAWLTLLKGASLIYYPHFIDITTNLFLQNINIAYGAAGIEFLFGILLCYFGFRKK